MSDPRQFTSLKPYLTLPQLFSLTWLAYPILSLVFVAFRLHISSGQAADAVADAKGTLLTSCRAAEKAASSAASLPRFLAQGTNDQIVAAVNGTLNGARGALILSLTIMQGIIEFIVDMYRSTFLCFLELVVRGSLELLIGASREVTEFVQNTLQSIGNGLQGQVNGVNNAINGAIQVIKDVAGVFGGNVDIPPVSIDLSGLTNVQIPNTFANALTELNSTIPSLDQLREAIDQVIAIPFDRVKSEINQTFSEISFDSSVLPVPQPNTMSFCSSLDTSVVDRLGADLVQITKIAFILIIVIIILLILGNCALEWWKYRTLMDNIETTREAWASDPVVMQQSGKTGGVPTLTMTNYNMLELHAASNHPLFMLFTNKVSALLRLSRSQHIHMRWFFTYVFHPPALACFLIGLFGLLSVELQLAAIGPLADKYNGEVANTVSNFTLLIGESINSSMHNDSAAYALAVNTQVDGIQTTINEGMFGWVEETTSVLNNTLVTFYDEVQKAIDTVFGGTVLEQPMEQFIFCLIGTKVVAFENALTFLHDNLRVDLPRANENVLMISQESMDEVAQPISLAAVGDQNDAENSGGLVGRLIVRYESALKKERTMFLIFLGLWGFVVLIALSIIAYHSYVLPAIERRKKQEWEREARSFASTPYLPGGLPVDEKGSFDRSHSSSPVSPPLGFSDGRKRHDTSSWDENMDKSSPTSGGNKLIAFGRKHRRGDTFILDSSSDRSPSPPPVQAPGIWQRIRGMFGRKSEDKEEDWIADSPSRSQSLPAPLMPAPVGMAGRPLPPPPPPQRKLPPPLLGVSKPAAKTLRESLSAAEQFRFPPPPRQVPVPMPLHHGFARQVPNDLPRTPTEFLTPSHNPNHARKSSQTLAPAMNLVVPPLRKNNPFATPLDTREVSPFTDPTDRLEPSPFADPFAATNRFSSPHAPVVGRAI